MYAKIGNHEVHMKGRIVGIGSLGAVAWLAFAPLVSSAANFWYVAPEGSDGNAGTGWSAPLATVQKAVAKAASGDTITVSNGVYLLDEPIVVPKDKKLAISSFEGKSETVVLDGQNKTNCVVFLKPDANVLSCMTIRNGVGSACVPENSNVYAGGVYLAAGSLYNLCVSNCHSRIDVGASTPICRGGGIAQESGHATFVTVVDCSIELTTTATSVPECTGGGVYTTGLVSDSVISNCSVVVTAPNCTGESAWQVSGGGLMSCGSSVHERIRIYGCRAILEASAGSSGAGGGAFLMGSNDKLQDSLVVGCIASRQGGGVSIRASGALTYCTISNNTVAVRCNRGGTGGAGVMFDSHYAGAKVIDGCEIVGNVMTNLAGTTGWTDCGGGGVMFCGGSSTCSNIVRNSVIRDNAAWCYGGGIYFYQCYKHALVTNCWFSSNRASNRGGFAYVTVWGGGLVTDCRFDGHSAGNCLGKTSRGDGQFLVRHSDSGTSNNDFTVRNSFITGNDPQGAGGTLVWFYKGSAGHSPLTFEQCTFAGNGLNTTDGTLFGFSWNTNPSVTVASNFTCRGCVIANNPRYGLFNAGSTFMETVTNVLTCSYTDNTTGLVTTGNEVRQNLWPAIAPNPLFADAANGDWRLLSGSPLKDAGGVAQAWMGSGEKRRGAMDMGDGTFTVTRKANTTWGVTVARNQPRQRLFDGVPDMGCFECYIPGGLLMLVR